MNNTSTPATQHQNTSINPFARALQEARGGQSEDFLENQQNSDRANDFGTDPFQSSPEDQRKNQLEQMRRARLRDQLHRQINPVEAHDVFNAREQQVKKEIDSIRYELKMLVQEVVAFEKEVDLTLQTNVAQPGQDGAYYISFFQQLRAFIMLLRQKVSSARTWATTWNSRKRKMGSAPGMQISGKSYEQTATVFDQMHHERATAYAGG